MIIMTHSKPIEIRSEKASVFSHGNKVKFYIKLGQRPLALWAESAERRQYYGEKQVGFGSNHPKTGFIIELKWYDR